MTKKVKVTIMVGVTEDGSWSGYGSSDFSMREAKSAASPDDVGEFTWYAVEAELPIPDTEAIEAFEGTVTEQV